MRLNWQTVALCAVFLAAFAINHAESDKLKIKLIAAKVGVGALLLKQMKNRKLFVAPFPLPVPLPFPVHKQPIIYPPPKQVPIIVPKYVPVVKYVPRYVPIHHHKKEETYVVEENYPTYESSYSPPKGKPSSYGGGRGKGSKGGKGSDYSASASNIAGLGHLHGGIGLEASDLDHMALDSVPLGSLYGGSRRSSKKRLSGLKGTDDFMSGLSLDDLPIETLESLTKEIKSLRELSSVYPSKRVRKSAKRYRSAYRPHYAESKVVETIVPAPIDLVKSSSSLNKPFGLPSSSANSGSIHKISDFSAVVPHYVSAYNAARS